MMFSQKRGKSVLHWKSAIYVYVLSVLKFECGKSNNKYTNNRYDNVLASNCLFQHCFALILFARRFAISETYKISLCVEIKAHSIALHTYILMLLDVSGYNGIKLHDE